MGNGPEHLQSPSVESPRKLARRDSGASLHHDDYGDYQETPEQLALGIVEDGHWYTTRQKLIQSTQGLKFPASQLPQHLDGPLSLIRTKQPTGKERTKKFHLALTTRLTVGCGLDATKCDIITSDEIIPLQTSQSVITGDPDRSLCARCFKFFYWDLAALDRLSNNHLAAEAPSLEEDLDISDSDSMASVSDASLPSNDSDSENEALRPPDPA